MNKDSENENESFDVKAQFQNQELVDETDQMENDFRKLVINISQESQDKKYTLFNIMFNALYGDFRFFFKIGNYVKKRILEDS